ncbi:hypothetical protein J4727_09050 [Providencia rettgeri]|uniref:Uncharacterized protein n=1 Tax=Providencia rettgeri TaxID=587 RepID=A0A939NG87_PRORE|nr:hypothetical protein [Providencia rettgeri]
MENKGNSLRWAVVANQWHCKATTRSLNEGGFNLQRYYLANRIIGVLKSKNRIIKKDCSVRQSYP